MQLSKIILKKLHQLTKKHTNLIMVRIMGALFDIVGTNYFHYLTNASMQSDETDEYNESSHSMMATTL